MRLAPSCWAAALLLTLAATWMGCGSGGVKEQNIKTSEPAAIEMAKTILQGYAEGKPVESEILRFDEIVEEVKRQDPEKAAVLERGFAEIKGLMDSPSAIPKKAKEILAQLEGQG